MAIAKSGAVILRQNEQRLVYNKRCNFCGYVDKTPIEVQTPSGGAYISGYGNCQKCKQPYPVTINGEWREKKVETNQLTVEPVKKVMHESPTPETKSKRKQGGIPLLDRPTATTNGQLNVFQVTFGAFVCFFFFAGLLYLAAKILGMGSSAWLFSEIVSGILTLAVVAGNLKGRMHLGLIVVPVASYMIYTVINMF